MQNASLDSILLLYSWYLDIYLDILSCCKRLGAICLVMLYFARCNAPVVIALLCATVGVNGLNFSSVSCNHIDIAPRFAGTLMGFTNCVANTMGFLAPMIIGQIIDGHVSNLSILLSQLNYVGIYYIIYF